MEPPAKFETAREAAPPKDGRWCAMSEIVPMAEGYIQSFREAVDRVAREHLYLALLEAPSLELTREFVLGLLREGHPQFVALEKDAVVGWCDIVSGSRPVFRHSGVLGMGVIREHRGRGIGTALLEATLRAAREKGLTRIELTVRTDNERARRLYEKFGFVLEGTLRRHMLFDGEYKDSDQMALLL
jgi:RimJ/RimL family protein N-acetyltransferase